MNEKINTIEELKDWYGKEEVKLMEEKEVNDVQYLIEMHRLQNEYYTKFIELQINEKDTMRNMNKQEEMIRDFQCSLRYIRSALPRRQQDLAICSRLDKGKINELENCLVDMTKEEYVAIRTAIERLILSGNASKKSIVEYYYFLYRPDDNVLFELSNFYTKVSGYIRTKRDMIKILASIPSPFIEELVDIDEIVEFIKNDNKVSWMTEMSK